MNISYKNKKALHDYEILEKIEAGIELKGFEVKSIRAGKLNLTESYAQCENGQIFIHNMHIAPYQHCGSWSVDPYRKRRLLLHKKQINHLSSSVERKKLTLIPLSVYFNSKQRVKVEVALCRGKRKYDKRQKIAEQENRRRLDKLRKEWLKR